MIIYILNRIKCLIKYVIYKSYLIINIYYFGDYNNKIFKYIMALLLVIIISKIILESKLRLYLK